MSDVNQYPEYVDSRTAAQILGVKQSKVFYHAERGEIALEPGRTRKDSRYKVSDILLLKARLQEKRRRPEPTIKDWVRLEDLPAAFKLAQQVYGPAGVDLATMATYQSWRKNNNQITMGAFSKDRSECYATIQLVPLDETVILDILSERRRENSIQPDEIRSYEAPGAYTLLATSAVYTQEEQHRHLLIELLIHYMDWWAKQYPERWISRVYAQAETERGEMLVQHFFMLPRWDLASNAFMLDLTRPSASKIVRSFQNRLRERGTWPPPLPDAGQQIQPGAIRTPEAPLYQFKADRESVQAEVPQINVTTPERAKTTPALQSPTVPRTAPVSRSHTQKEALPEGYVSAEGFGNRHGIAPSTWRKAVTSERLHVSKNDWVSGRAPVKVALSPEQQQAFLQVYRSNQNFHQCELADCPCHDKP